MTTITIDRALLEQALEALNSIDVGYRSPNGNPLEVSFDEEKCEAAITALRAALAQEQPNPPGCEHCNHPLYAATKCRVCGRVTEQTEPVQSHRWKGDHNIESPANACMHKSYCMSLKAEPVQKLERFYALAVAAEREACAKVCDDKAKETFSGQCQVWGDYFARAIRARSKE